MPFSQHHLLAQPAAWGVKFSTRPSQRATHTQLASFVPKTRPRHGTASNDTTWDNLSKTGVQTLEGHKSNVSFAMCRPMLPIIVIGSEDGTV